MLATRAVREAPPRIDTQPREPVEIAIGEERGKLGSAQCGMTPTGESACGEQI
jgi:hypothetical protein